MRKSSIIKIIALIGIVWFVSQYLVMPYYAASATVDSALGELARAESAQTPDGAIYHVKNAKQLLPATGAVIWWAPEKADFSDIQAELDSILLRAKNISSLGPDSEIFNSELYDIHAKLRDIQETLIAF